MKVSLKNASLYTSWKRTVCRSSLAVAIFTYLLTGMPHPVAHSQSPLSVSKNAPPLLLEAIKSRQEKRIQTLLQQNVDVNTSDEEGITPLIAAIGFPSFSYIPDAQTRFQLVKRLLEKGVHVNEKDKDGNTALIYAAEQGYLDICKLLINRGADVNAHEKTGRNALIGAAGVGALDTIRYLVRKGARINDRTGDGETALLSLIGRTYTPELVAVIVDLIARGADVNASSLDGTTSLMRVVKRGGRGSALLRPLLKSRAAVNAQDSTGATALMYASWKRDYEKVECLLNAGSDVNLRDKLGGSALIWATMGLPTDIPRRNNRIIALLLRYKANPNILLESGLLRVKAGITPLSFVCANLDRFGLKAVQVLLKGGANPKFDEGKAYTLASLDSASHELYRKVLILLLRYGAPIDGRDSNGETALMLMARRGRLNAVKLLIDRGASVNLINQGGKSALDIAREAGYRKVADYIATYASHRTISPKAKERCMGTVRYNVMNGRVLSETRNGVQRDYQTDATGNTLALWDNTQTKTDTFDYFAYGKVANRTGTTATPFQFGGGLGYYQNDSNRTHVRARNFYVNLGKWSSQDPIGFNGGDYNLYRYTRNNPVRWVDPSGLVVDNADQVTDLGGFLSPDKQKRFLYTCRCGWMDKSHLPTAYYAAQTMYRYYRDGDVPSYKYGVYDVVEAAGPQLWGLDDVHLGVVNLKGIPSFARREISAWISYGLSWLVEDLEYQVGKITPGPIGHRIWESAWSYEDPPSNWLGAVTFMKTWIPWVTWDNAATKFLKLCVPMSKEQALRLYNGMESYKGYPPMYHRDDSFKNYPPWNRNALTYLPDKDFFHTWVKGGPYTDCCGIPAASIPPLLRLPKDIYTDTYAIQYVSQHIANGVTTVRVP